MGRVCDQWFCGARLTRLLRPSSRGAMLLARRGYRVLLVDSAWFPGDTTASIAKPTLAPDWLRAQRGSVAA